MSRHYLFIAAGVLLLAAAVIHFTGSPGDPPGDGNQPEKTSPSAKESPGSVASDGEMNAHELVDPLIPPIRIEGINAFDGDPNGPNLFDPESLVGRIAATADFSSDAAAHFHAHGQEVCASGCATSNHPTKKLTRDHFHELLEQYAQEPMDETSFALESLLYFGRQTLVMLNDEGDFPLDPLRSDFLRSELKKTHAKVEVRVVDEYGEIRVWLPPTRVPLDRRHEFDMQVNNLQPLITSGTVKRVGLYHLWNRL